MSEQRRRQATGDTASSASGGNSDAYAKAWNAWLSVNKGNLNRDHEQGFEEAWEARSADVARLEGVVAEARVVIRKLRNEGDAMIAYGIADEWLARPDGEHAARVIAAAVEETETEDAQDKAWKSTELYDTQHWDYRQEESRAKRRAAVDAYRVRS